MKRTLTLMTTILVLTGAASANSLDMETSSYSFEIDSAGESYKKNLTVSWNGETPVVAEPVTEIEAESTNSKGIYVEYSPDQFIINPDEERTFTAEILTSPALIPDNFTVTTKVETEYPVEYRSSGGGGSDYEIIEQDEIVLPENSSFIDEYGEEMNASEMEDLENRIRNFTEEYFEKVEDKNRKINDLNQTLKEKEDQKDSLEDRIESLESKVEEQKEETKSSVPEMLQETAVENSIVFISAFLALMVGSVVYLKRDSIGNKLGSFKNFLKDKVS